MKMLSYKYKDSHFKVKVVSHVTYPYKGDPVRGKIV